MCGKKAIRPGFVCLELGTGAGLPSLAALALGASRVVATDRYNNHTSAHLHISISFHVITILQEKNFL